MKISMSIAKKRIATVWFSFGGFLFIIMFIQTLGEHYGAKVNEAWSWFLPTIFPTLSLIIAVLISDAKEINNTQKYVDKFLFHLTMIVSIVYLLLIFLVIFIDPLSPNISNIELMKLSGLGLGPFQGIVIACLGVFFSKQGTQN